VCFINGFRKLASAAAAQGPRFPQYVQDSFNTQGFACCDLRDQVIAPVFFPLYKKGLYVVKKNIMLRSALPESGDGKQDYRSFLSFFFFTILLRQTLFLSLSFSFMVVPPRLLHRHKSDI